MLKRLLKVAAVATLLLGLLALLAPTIASMLGIATDIATDAVAARVNGTVQIADVRLRWRGPQDVTGLLITDPDGTLVTDVDVQVAGGLLAMLGDEPLDLAVDGAVAGTLREDGTLSWQDVVQRGGGGGGATPQSPARVVALSFDGIELTLDDAVSGRTVQVGVVGGVDIVPGGTSAAWVDCGLPDGGILNIDVEAMEILDAFGAVTLDGASLDADVNGVGLPLLHTRLDGRITSLMLEVRSDDLTRRGIIRGTVTLETDDAGESLVQVMASLPDWTGTLQAWDVPTGLFATVLDLPGLDLGRDVGPTVGIEAARAGDDGVTDVRVTGSAATVHVVGAFDPGTDVEPTARADARLDLTPFVRQEVLGRLCPIFQDVVSGEPVVIEVGETRVPLDGDLSRLDADVTVALGDVRFAPQSPMMNEIARLVTAFGAESDIASIEPVAIEIRGGVARIPELSGQIGGHPFTLSGQVDLTTDTITFDMGVPGQLVQLTRVRELELLGEFVDLRVHGPAANPVVEPVIKPFTPENVIEKIFDLFGR